MERQVYVFIDLAGKAHRVGTLWARANRGHESASFEYHHSWLDNPASFALEPALAKISGPQHTQPGRFIFGAFGDSAPDRWGRILLQRDERLSARAQKREPCALRESDYLLRVSDFTRQGALRFAEEEGGAFFAPSDRKQVPPLVFLPKLLAAASAIGTEEEKDEDVKLLVAPGSSLGGARPKASVIDKDGALSMAKFPLKDDTARRAASHLHFFLLQCRWPKPPPATWAEKPTAVPVCGRSAQEMLHLPPPQIGMRPAG